MRLFSVICLLLIVTMQVQAWPWSGKKSKKEAQKTAVTEQEAAPVFEVPQLEKEIEALSAENASKDNAADQLSPIKILAKIDPVSPEKEAAVQKISPSIVGKGQIKAEKLVSFFLSENKTANKNYIEELVQHYITESEIEGINHDIAFAQMCLETGFLKFGGLVNAEMNNFCGLGSTGPGVPGASFPTPQTGIRAHIQHLQAYATNLPLQNEQVDPRYHLVRRGSAPVVKNLAGTWAADPNYAEKIETILGRIYLFEESAEN